MGRFSIGIALVLSALIYTSTFGQSPEGMAYQAVVRNGTGAPAISTPVGMRFSILQGSSTGNALYVETQSATTNGQGVVALTIGAGSPVSGTFTAIDWANGPYFLKVEVDPNNQGTYPLSNVSQLQSVPYALYAKSSSSSYWSINPSGGVYPSNGGNVGIGTATPNGMLEVKGTDSDPTVPLFEVKDINGNPVFAVYPDGVEVTVDIAATGRPAKGGFAVSGRNSTRGTTTDIMRVTPDSTTIFINNALGRPAKGGFAVSGRNSTRADVTSTILAINADSTRIYTGDPTKGFGVGQANGLSTDSYLKLLPDNYFIGHQSGLTTTGLYNTFFGYRAGFANTTGSSNIFIGYQTGYSNQTGANNVAVGNVAGYLGAGGVSNVFIGDSAGYGNTNSFNVFLGKGSGKSNTGSYNAFLGYQAGLKNTSGTNNVFIGNQTGFNNTTGAYNTFLGYNAGYALATNSYNTYLGYQAGANANGGDYNLGLGPYAGYKNKGDYNVFIGYESGYNNISGADPRFSKWNTFIGFQSGRGNTTGWHNLFIGYQAGLNNQVATNQFFIGNGSGAAITAGYANTFVGHSTGGNSTDCSNNTFVGYFTGWNNLTGNNNTYVGNAAGLSGTGSDNVLIGNYAGTNATGSGNIFIGSGAGYNTAGSNLLFIENSSTATPLIGGDFSNNRVGINRMPTTYTLEVGGTIWANGSAISAGSSTWSDRRFKTNIVPIPDALNIVMKLNGVRFDWNKGAFPDRNFTDGKQVGLIAQDVETVLPEVVSTDGDGYKSVAYDKVSAVLVEAIKQQQNQIEDLKAQVAKLSEQVKQLLNSK